MTIIYDDDGDKYNNNNSSSSSSSSSSTDLGASHESILHDCNKLLVTEFSISIDIKELKHDVNNMAVE